MSDKLDNLLILSSQDDFHERFTEIRAAVFRATHFEPGSKEAIQLNEILDKVILEKDKAVAELTEKFDGVKLNPSEFRVPKEELERAHKQIDADLMHTLRKAISNVRKYQSEIFIGDKFEHPGVKFTPIRRVGICVPGASAPLPSTVIMTAVPAQVAGVEQIAVVSPPRWQGSIHPVILGLCRELEIDEVYRIGGAQAVMALAQGTETIANVDKIVGPGNQWVSMAKKAVLGLVGIDSVAGPSEVLIIANDQARSDWVAADMLSQVEHGPGSAVVFTDSKDFAEDVLKELKSQVIQLERSSQAMECLEKFSGIVVFDNLDQIIDWANLFAAEHLQIQWADNSREIADRINNAGAIFIGPYTPVAVGDYWAGPSHTLPTGTSARFFSALSSNDFIKSSSIIEYDKATLVKNSADIIKLANVEGLDAHAKSVKIRSENQ